MIAKYTSLLALFMLCFVSCTQGAAPDETVNQSQTKQIVISLSDIKSFSSENPTEINKVDVISFARKNDEAKYTYETGIYNLSPTTTENGDQITLTLHGSLPRIFYLIANADSRIIMPVLNPNTTAEEFESGTWIQEEKIPAEPCILTVKKVLDEPDIENNIEAEFSRTMAYLDIANEYSGFAMDSIVLQNAKGGTYLFNENLPLGNHSINYGNSSQMLIYPVKEANLAVYGKNDGVRMAFDIPLNNIAKGTRYRVSFRGTNEPSTTLEGKLQWKVTVWNSGASITSTPDWNRN